jgi:hypothetical protein
MDGVSVEPWANAPSMLIAITSEGGALASPPPSGDLRQLADP